MVKNTDHSSVLHIFGTPLEQIPLEEVPCKKNHTRTSFALWFNINTERLLSYIELATLARFSFSILYLIWRHSALKVFWERNFWQKVHHSFGNHVSPASRPLMRVILTSLFKIKMIAFMGKENVRTKVIIQNVLKQLFNSSVFQELKRRKRKEYYHSKSFNSNYENITYSSVKSL